jgi:hypothetical protein
VTTAKSSTEELPMMLELAFEMLLARVFALTCENSNLPIPLLVTVSPT